MRVLAVLFSMVITHVAAGTHMSFRGVRNATDRAYLIKRTGNGPPAGLNTFIFETKKFGQGSHMAFHSLVELVRSPRPDRLAPKDLVRLLWRPGQIENTFQPDDFHQLPPVDKNGACIQSPFNTRSKQVKMFLGAASILQPCRHQAYIVAEGCKFAGSIHPRQVRQKMRRRPEAVPPIPWWINENGHGSTMPKNAAPHKAGRC